eukprot:scaffold61863_cov37-Tisochrysis_lutea.AAC.1
MSGGCTPLTGTSLSLTILRLRLAEPTGKASNKEKRAFLELKSHLCNARVGVEELKLFAESQVRRPEHMPRPRVCKGLSECRGCTCTTSKDQPSPLLDTGTRLDQGP